MNSLCVRIAMRAERRNERQIRKPRTSNEQQMIALTMIIINGGRPAIRKT